MKKTISIDLQLTVLKPIARVFAAVANPVPYFVEKTSGPLKEGKTVHWKFPEMPALIPVTVKKVVPNRLIRFAWDSGSGGKNSCEFRFARPQKHNPKATSGKNATTVSIRESGWPVNAKGRTLSYGNMMGWTHMACALKAYLEHGVNLRKGAFLHYKF